MVIVLALVAAGIGTYVLLARDDEGGPEAVVQQYFDAVVDRDCDAMVDTPALGEQSRAEAIAECREFVEVLESADGADLGPEAAAFVPSELVSTSVVSESDSEATVEVEFRTQTASATETVQIEAAGEWRVDPDRPFDGGSVDVPTDEPVTPPDVDGPGDDPASRPRFGLGRRDVGPAARQPGGCRLARAGRTGRELCRRRHGRLRRPLLGHRGRR